ncbi:hypothetical protein [Reichenbachiella ulvae]|uniref:EF-hand domain-containing protein n=1 Tax=Reichenbachiella ulvae TaxID=2980104 RepID=A0ABT3CPJ5_9BACT|nr:hypothetical protein [Reichenbachiella ulvae]MCV9385463.1 hypothetical protein [Reichenbachiella ulvae]
MKRPLAILILGLLVWGCTDKKLERKGFQVSEISKDDKGKKIIGLPIDSLQLDSQPRNVLLTHYPDHRLTPLFKVNIDKDSGKPFTGSNRHHYTWREDNNDGNNWNNHLMPGFSVVRGYNMINVSHYNYQTQSQNEFFKKPVLIKNLYYPSYSKDSLHYEPVSRDYYMISVYDEDSNQDGFINVQDLRRFYWFDIDGNLSEALVPKIYSVMSSDYDAGNDLMYVSARLDENQNGQMEAEEAIHIFWIDLKDPRKRGLQYKSS